jgi:hypothetical protein
MGFTLWVLRESWRKHREKQRLKEEEVDAKELQKETEEMSSIQKGLAIPIPEKDMNGTRELESMIAFPDSAESEQSGQAEIMTITLQGGIGEEPSIGDTSHGLDLQAGPHEIPVEGSPSSDQGTTTTKMAMGFGLKFDTSKTKQSVQRAFASVAEEELQQQHKRRRILIPIIYTENELRASGLSERQIKQRLQEDKKRAAQAIIDQIPVDSADLFSYELDYDLMTEVSGFK